MKKQTNYKPRYWIAFFDENGHLLAGSDEAHSFYGMPEIRRLKERGYCFPKRAKGYMIFSDHEFISKTWKQIEAEYSFGWGGKL